MRTVIATTATIATLILTLCGSAAFACGHCVEDKIAAVYDHGLITQALARKFHVVFFAIEGDFIADESTRKSIEAAVLSIDGVNKSSIKVSVEQAALSFVVDPARQSIGTIQKALDQNRLKGNITFLMLKVMEHPEPLR